MSVKGEQFLEFGAGKREESSVLTRFGGAAPVL